MKERGWTSQLARVLPWFLLALVVGLDVGQAQINARINERVDALEAEVSELRQGRADGGARAAVDRAVALTALAGEAVREARAAVERQNEALEAEREAP